MIYQQQKKTPKYKQQKKIDVIIPVFLKLKEKILVAKLIRLSVIWKEGHSSTLKKPEVSIICTKLNCPFWHFNKFATFFFFSFSVFFFFLRLPNSFYSHCLTRVAKHYQ